jgi:hypothetical protein
VIILAVADDRGEDSAINRCMRVPDRTAQRGHAAFGGWCPSAARCCSLLSQLRSRGGSPVPCPITGVGVQSTARSTESFLLIVHHRHRWEREPTCRA